MKYPKRANQHVAETHSVTISRSQIPDEWIVRDLTERDYGVDLYVELVGKNRLVTGNLVAFQVKAVEEVKPPGDLFTVTGIKRETLNYWLRLPVPVFLVAVCFTRKRAYWANIQELSRDGRFNRASARVSVRLNAQCDFSPKASRIPIFFSPDQTHVRLRPPQLDVRAGKSCPPM